MIIITSSRISEDSRLFLDQVKSTSNGRLHSAAIQSTNFNDHRIQFRIVGGNGLAVEVRQHDVGCKTIKVLLAAFRESTCLGVSKESLHWPVEHSERLSRIVGEDYIPHLF